MGWLEVWCLLTIGRWQAGQDSSFGADGSGAGGLDFAARTGRGE
jgi:hypothetical protein